MSMPTSAAGSSPTGDSTLNRPPTSGGTLSVAMPSRAAISRSAPRAGSVVNTRWRWAAAPSASSSQARTTRYCAIVSAVPPDLLMTLTSTRRGSIRRSAAPIVVGSTLSSTVSRGKNSRPSSSHSFQAGRRSAVSSARAPSAEPPMPSTSDVVVRLAQALGEGRDLAHRLGLVDQLVEAVLARGAAAADLRLHGAEAGRPARPGARAGAHACRRARPAACVRRPA